MAVPNVLQSGFVDREIRWLWSRPRHPFRWWAAYDAAAAVHRDVDARRGADAAAEGWSLQRLAGASPARTPFAAVPIARSSSVSSLSFVN